MVRFVSTLVCSLVFVAAAAAHPETPPPVFADLVVVNAKVWTVDRQRPEAEAVAAWHGKILAVGTTNEIKRLIGPNTTVVDAKGGRVLPGFHDSHVHMLG